MDNLDDVHAYVDEKAIDKEESCILARHCDGASSLSTTERKTFGGLIRPSVYSKGRRASNSAQKVLDRMEI